MSSRRKNRTLKATLATILLLEGVSSFAQDKSPVEFGKVAPADFVAPAGLDTTVDAVVLSDVGVRTFERPYPTSRAWDGHLQRTKRVLILRKRGFEAATVTIALGNFRSSNDEVTGLKAYTYNLEGGKVVQTELDKNSIYKIKNTEHVSAERFTFPAIREGSIIEYTYTLVSPFVLNNFFWQLQSNYPCLWSEFKATVPPAFAYSIMSRSAYPFTIESKESRQAVNGEGTGEVKTFHWAARNIPAMKEEPFTTTVNNYLARVELRVTGIEYSTYEAVYDPGTRRTDIYTADVIRGGVLISWRQINRLLLQSDHFGADLYSKNAWLDKDLLHVTAGAADEAGKARQIFDYVRDSFSCGSHFGLTMGSTIKSVYKARSGSAAELNLLLIAMLAHEKLNALPVVLSTRSNGFMDEMMPQTSVLNYVVCKLQTGDASLYLDASDRNLRFGQLPLECYNGYVDVVDTTRNSVQYALSADSLTENRKVVVFLSNGDKGGIDGTIQSFPGAAKSAEIRMKIKEQDGERTFLQKMQSESGVGETISDLTLDSLRIPDDPLVINYSCHLATDAVAEKFYFTPTLADRMTENPLKDAFRIYPVEMPYARDANYILTMEVPSGYEVEDMPKSVRVLLNNNGGYFDYVLSQDGDQIHFRTRIRLTRANFQPTDYEELRNFFATIVEKESEQIVFKRKK